MENGALINLFFEQLQNEINRIVIEKDLEHIGEGLIWWYFKRLYLMTDDEIEDAICDGSGDLGIDAIIKDEHDIIHFYQFKNLSNIEKGFPSGDVDKTISGLELIIRGRHGEIANEKLKEKLKEVLVTIPSGYQIHFVSTGKGLEKEAQIKLYAFIKSLNPPEEFLKICDEHIAYLQDLYYTRSLPTLNKVISFPLDNTPYMLRTAGHDCYTFTINAESLARLYKDYREKILQQNIRMSEGDSPTNEAIYRSCTNNDFENFYHYNNGVTILCDSAKWDAFSKQVEITKPQIVNGGQTVRILYKAFSKEELRENVNVQVRVITSNGDKEFAGNVAVNLNNQTRVQGSFLKSNNPRIVQLAAALRAKGWYLERRVGEINELTEDEKRTIESSIDGQLINRTIPLKEGTQAYVSCYYDNPGLARLNPAKMFLDVSDGGHFTKIFDSTLSAENFLKAFLIFKLIETRVSEFKKIKRRKKKDESWKEQYVKLLGEEFVSKRFPILEQVIPQCTIFATATCYHWYVIKNGLLLQDLLERLEGLPNTLSFILDQIISTQEESEEDWNKSWATLLKSQEFYQAIKLRLERL